jgi:probable HAF family extracellular repeat protein
MRELKISAFVLLYSLVGGALASGNALGNVHYVVTDMGAFAPAAINNNGQVAGNLAGGSSTLACIWSDGTTTGLGALGPGGASYAYGINQSGQVVGWSVVAGGGYAIAFLYSNGTMTPLGVLPGGSLTVAYGINDNGQIVGKGDVGEATHAFLYSNGTMTDLNGLIRPDSGWSIGAANAINDSGWIAATATNSAGQSQAVLLQPALPGDANLDGQVDVSDLTIVLANFGQSTGMGWGTGDFIGDGTVDVNDLTIVLANFGQGSGAGIRAVPEPSCLLLVGIGATGLLACASRRRR